MEGTNAFITVYYNYLLVIIIIVVLKAFYKKRKGEPRLLVSLVFNVRNLLFSHSKSEFCS